MDFVSKEKRRAIMVGVKSANTRPELRIRSLLHRHGYRFRIHVKSLPGTPDIVLRKYRAVIRVHGCFWHHHIKCGSARIPSSNQDFWQSKIERTIERDRSQEKSLSSLGWNVITIWECDLKDEEALLIKLKHALEASSSCCGPQSKFA